MVPIWVLAWVWFLDKISFPIPIPALGSVSVLTLVLVLVLVLGLGLGLVLVLGLLLVFYSTKAFKSITLPRMTIWLAVGIAAGMTHERMVEILGKDTADEIGERLYSVLDEKTMEQAGFRRSSP